MEIDIVSSFFYIFSAVLLYAAVRVVTSDNPVHAVLYLVLGFTQASALWMLLGAEFLSIVLIVVYVGAVMVLFLFVVMMLNIRISTVRSAFWRNLPLALLLGGVIAVEMIAVVFSGFDANQVGANNAVQGGGALELSNTKALGILMYGDYVYPIQVAAVLLLVAMLAAISLTLRGQRKDSRAIPAEQQIQVQAHDRLSLVSIRATPSVQDAPAADSVPTPPTPNNGSSGSTGSEGEKA